MALLELEHVTKRYGQGANERVALRDITLHLDAGELVSVWGQRRSGRSTLLRIAAAVEQPDEGCVRFEGRDLAGRDRDTIRGGIRYCRKTFHPAQGALVLDQLVTVQLGCGVASSVARSRARAVLDRLDVAGCAGMRPGNLDGLELMLVSIARALVLEPKVLVVDEPAIGVELTDRDRILALLLRLAHEGTAVLASTGDTTSLSGADRAILLGEGELHGEPATPQLAEVARLPSIERRQSA